MERRPERMPERRPGRHYRGRRKEKRFDRNMKNTLTAVVLLCTVGLILLLCQVYYVAEIKNEKYSRRVLSQQTYVSNPILYKRGDIVDRNGTALAINVKVYDLVISPKTILEDERNKEFTLQTLVDFFGINREALEAEINSRTTSQYMVIKEKKGLYEEEVTAFNNIVDEAKENYKESNPATTKVVGVWFEEKYERRYPLGTTACNIIGFTSGENGTKGIEQYYDDELVGSYGREYGYFDSQLKLQRTIKPAVDGNTVVSSIDSHVQTIVEKQIKKLNKDMGAENIGVVMMDPNNGEIIAMASDKVYNPNDPRDLSAYYTEEEIAALNQSEIDEKLNYMWNNFCTFNTYEPGSTFKTFTVAAALDEKAATQNSTYVCKGEMQVSDYVIGCANRIVHGTITPREALMESCNCALMQMAFSLGGDQFHRYVNNIFGFDKRTGIDIYGEMNGVTHDKDKIGIVELATSSFGQTQEVTMIQMASAFCSVINGGYYYEPHVVREIKSPGGSVISKNRGNVVRQTITSQTSDYIRSCLRDTVEEGTATPAKVAGYDIGGKTGTGETRDKSGDGATSENDYIVSFMGFAPVDNPQVVIYVVIDRPHVEDQAHSTYATEFAHDIMKETFPFLGIYKSGVNNVETDEVTTNDAGTDNSKMNDSAENNTEGTDE